MHSTVEQSLIFLRDSRVGHLEETRRDGIDFSWRRHFTRFHFSKQYSKNIFTKTLFVGLQNFRGDLQTQPGSFSASRVRNGHSGWKIPRNHVRRSKCVQLWPITDRSGCLKFERREFSPCFWYDLVSKPNFLIDNCSLDIQEVIQHFFVRKTRLYKNVQLPESKTY